jgi:DNA invertase Pin-like site-specific DNA recombinase
MTKANTSSAGHTVGYARVSTTDQDTARQKEALVQFGVDKLYEERISAKNLDRPVLKEALSYLREGDTLVVHSLDRLARNLSDLLKLVDQLQAKGTTLHFLKENLTFTPSKADPMATLMLSMLGAFAQFERSLIRERQMEGIALAKQAGVYQGRKQALSAVVQKQLIEEDMANNGKHRTSLAKKYNISRDTLYRYLRGDSSHPTN